MTLVGQAKIFRTSIGANDREFLQGMYNPLFGVTSFGVGRS